MNNKLILQEARIICTSLLLLLSFIATTNTNANDDGINNNRQRDTRITYDDEDIDLTLITPSPLSSSAPSSNNPTNVGTCERINVRLCSKMNYNFTRMPNHFKDSSQIDVDVRANLYFDLVKSKCSPYIHAYICELLTPVCSNDLTMRKFEIYPCRTFCKQIKNDCQEEILENAKRIRKQISPALIQQAAATSTIDPIYNSFMETFDCDLLPYEYNGGNGTNGGGPCHEVQPTTTTPPVIQNSNYDNNQYFKETNNDDINSSYHPYVPDINNPPFITDTSTIDSSYIKPIVDYGNDNNQNKNYHHHNQNKSQHDNNNHRTNHIISQVQTFGQTIYWTIQKYSNIISIATVIILLIALNSKRLTRFKNYLTFTPSSSSKSSLSSTCSNNNNKSLLGGSSNHHHHNHQKLFNNNNNNSSSSKVISSYPVVGSTGAHMSPSSSSRSLMLTMAGGQNGKQAPHHKLINTSTNGCNFSDLETSSIPSQQLLLGLNNKKTMININGTLERQQQQKLNGSPNGKYLMQMQRNAQASAIKQHYVQQQQQLHHHSSSDKQQLFNTLDSNSSHSNQYDVIQLDDEHYNHQQPLQRNHPNQRSTTTTRLNYNKQQQQQQQLYSNILLSSPGHQVLLFNNNNSIQNICHHQQNQNISQESSASASTITRNSNINNHHPSPRQAQPALLPGPRHLPSSSFFTNLASATTTVSQLSSPYADPNPSSSSSTVGSRRVA